DSEGEKAQEVEPSVEDQANRGHESGVARPFCAGVLILSTGSPPTRGRLQKTGSPPSRGRPYGRSWLLDDCGAEGRGRLVRDGAAGRALQGERGEPELGVA